MASQRADILWRWGSLLGATLAEGRSLMDIVFDIENNRLRGGIELDERESVFGALGRWRRSWR